MAGEVRRTMIEGAARLLSRRGLDGTSFADVLAATGAPRGSLYHHFPGGKNELVAEAVRYSGELLVIGMGEPADGDPADVIDRFTGLWRLLLTGREPAGCSVAAVVIGSPRDEALREVVAEVFARWTEMLTTHLERAGMATAAARDLALTAIATVEGALMLTRATGDVATYDRITSSLRAAAKAAGGDSAS